VSFWIATGVVTVAGTIFERLLIREGFPRIDLLLAANFMSGIIAGFLYTRVRINDIETRRLAEERLAKIAEMNHHIRNALQVLSFHARNPSNVEAVAMIDEAIRRIEWTLQEVLPRGWNLRREETHQTRGFEQIETQSTYINGRR
jgi:hypothetical protein